MKPSSSPTVSAIPVFPLPDFHLFPRAVAPLHIFEPRYRQMIRDMMDGPGRMVTVPFRPEGPRVVAGPALPALGTLAEIVQTEELGDGRWLILLLALARVEVAEVPSDDPYRRVDATVIGEPEIVGEAAGALRTRLTEALRARTNGNWEDDAGDTPVGRLADVLLHALALEPERRSRAYTERDPVARAAMALAWHDLAELTEDDRDHDPDVD